MKQPTTRQRLSEALRERDEASATIMLLVTQMRVLIQKLRETRLAMIEEECEAAEKLLVKATRRK